MTPSLDRLLTLEHSYDRSADILNSAVQVVEHSRLEPLDSQGLADAPGGASGLCCSGQGSTQGERQVGGGWLSQKMRLRCQS